MPSRMTGETPTTTFVTLTGPKTDLFEMPEAERRSRNTELMLLKLH